jgi:hypothetical protein
MSPASPKKVTLPSPEEVMYRIFSTRTFVPSNHQSKITNQKEKWTIENQKWMRCFIMPTDVYTSTKG